MARGEASVRPYPSLIFPAVSSSKFLNASMGKGAEPQLKTLMDEIPDSRIRG